MSPLTTSGMDIGVLHGAHRGPVRAALVELAARAAVHGDHADAGGLRAARKLGRVDRIVVPAEPHLQRHRHRDRADRRLDQRQRMIEIAHQRGARLPVGHVLRRAAHVDVDDFGARGFGDARALRHPVRLAAGKLHDVRAGALAFHPQHGVGAAFDQRVARGHLRDDEAGAELRHEPAERCIGDAGHRREQNRILHCNIADAESRDRTGDSSEPCLSRCLFTLCIRIRRSRDLHRV